MLSLNKQAKIIANSSGNFSCLRDQRRGAYKPKLRPAIVDNVKNKGLFTGKGTQVPIE